MEKHVCSKKAKINFINDKKQSKKFENIVNKKIDNKSKKTINESNKISEIIGFYEIKKEEKNSIYQFF